jgi:hypothetical protein
VLAVGGDGLAAGSARFAGSFSESAAPAVSIFVGIQFPENGGCFGVVR